MIIIVLKILKFILDFRQIKSAEQIKAKLLAAPKENKAGFTYSNIAAIIFLMVNYILLYKIRKVVKQILKEKIEDGEIATTPRSCLGCLADEISWEIYYLFKEREEKKKSSNEGSLDSSGGMKDI